MKTKNLSVREENINNASHKGTKLVALSLALLLTGTMASGCTKKMDCKVGTDHAHEYVSDDGFISYRNSENAVIGDSNWTNQYVPATDEINEMGKFGLFKIADNMEPLYEEIEGQVPYTEYEYKYSSFMMVGKVPITTTHKRWTSDSEHSRLTGQMRDASYKYYGYRIGTDKKGNRILIKSEEVDDIFSIASEYSYFKPSDYHTTVYTEPYTKEQVKELAY